MGRRREGAAHSSSPPFFTPPPLDNDHIAISAQCAKVRLVVVKLDDLHARFRDHTNHLFVKHGMRLIGFWVPADEDNKLVYVLAFPSIEEREKSWADFREDPEWIAAKEASERMTKFSALY